MASVLAGRRGRKRRMVVITLGVLLLYVLGVVACAALAAAQANDLRALPSSLTGGGNLPQVAQRAARSLDGLRSSLERLRFVASPLLVLAGAARPLPSVGPALAALPVLLDAAVDGAAAGVELTDNAASALLTDDGSVGVAAMLKRVEVARPSLVRAEGLMARVQARLRDLPPLTALPQSLATPLERVVALVGRGQGALMVAAHAQELLGGAGDRNYLLLGQNNDELRATGGFISTAGIVTLRDGDVVNLDYRDSYDMDGTKPRARRPAPLPLERYMLIPDFRFRDANWWADFPTTSQALQSLLLQDLDLRVDGVIAYDQAVVQGVLRQLGPVELPTFGETVSAENMIRLMEIYAHPPGYKLDFNPEDLRLVITGDRKQIIKDLAAAILKRVSKLSGDEMRSLGSVVFTMLEQKHVLVALNGEGAARGLAQLGWDGSLRPLPRGDALLVVETNVGYSKANRTVTSALDYRVDLAGTSQPPTATLTISYANSNAEPARHCAAETIDYLTSDDSCYKSYVRVYTPPGTVPIAVEGVAGPFEWFTESGGTVIAGLLVLPPGAQKTLTFTYQLPRSTLPVDGAYDLLLQKQPGVNSLPVRVRVGNAERSMTLAQDTQFTLAP